MFCSKCGKTLTGDSDRCPHCGESIGESRFEGNGYTAAQQRFLSGEDSQADRTATPYTRITYTSMGDAPEDEEGDIYSKTTYRPALKETPKSAEAELQAAAEQDQAKQAFEALSRTATVAPSRANRAGDAGEALVASDASEARSAGPYAAVLKPVEIPAGESDVSVIVSPLKPIKKTGISPEVEQYIRRMNEQKGRAAKRQPKSAGAAVAAVADIAPSGDEMLDRLAAEAELPVEDAVEGAPGRRKRASKHRLPGWVKAISIICCIALILGGALWALMQNVGTSSPLEGVTDNLRREGLALISSRELQTYREPLARTLTADPVNGPQKLVEEQEKAKLEIAALMPENALENDKLFINVVYNLQKMVDSAVMQDALALANASDAALAASLAEESGQTWNRIHDLISRLDSAKEAPQLQGIYQDTRELSATPAPEVTPEPPEYETLTSGMNNNKNVRRMQIRLNQLKWFNGKIDGDFGPVTVTAVKRFQQAAGLEVTGIADSAMQELLHSTDAPKFGKNGTPEPTGAPTLASGGGNIIDPGADADADGGTDDAPTS